MKLKKRTIICGAILICFLVPLIPGTGKSLANTIIIAEADADVDSTNPTANNGGHYYLEISNTTSTTQGIHIGYIRFSLSSISGTITEVFLKLRTSTFLSETHTIGIHFCSDITWNELTINYNNKPAYDTEAIATQLIASGSTWYSWMVTTTVQNAFSTGKVSFAIISQDLHEFAFINFESKDQDYSWMEERSPYLEVKTTSTSTKTPGISFYSFFISMAILVLLFRKTRIS